MRKNLALILAVSIRGFINKQKEFMLTKKLEGLAQRTMTDYVNHFRYVNNWIYKIMPEFIRNDDYISTDYGLRWCQMDTLKGTVIVAQRQNALCDVFKVDLMKNYKSMFFEGDYLMNMLRGAPG